MKNSELQLSPATKDILAALCEDIASASLTADTHAEATSNARPLTATTTSPRPS